MKSRKFVSACFAVMVLAVLATSCSQSNKKDGEGTKTKGVIGITCMDLGNPFFKLITDVMEEEAKKHGYTVLALGADNNQYKTRKLMAS